MTDATAMYRNPVAPLGYDQSSSSLFEVPIKQMERAFIDGQYFHDVGIMIGSPFMADPDIPGLSDFTPNSSDEETNLIPIVQLGDVDPHCTEIKKEIESVEVKKAAVADLKSKGAVEETRSEGPSKRVRKDEDDKSGMPKKSKRKKSTKKDKGKKLKLVADYSNSSEYSDSDSSIKYDSSYSRRKHYKYSRSPSPLNYKVKETDTHEYMGSRSRHRRYKHYSRSPSPLDNNVKVKEEADTHGYVGSPSRRQHYKQYSRSPSPIDNNVKVKEETEEVKEIYGYYNCEVCHITMNSACTYKTHIEGRRHIKNLNAKNMAAAVQSKSYPQPGVDLNKYPIVPLGVTRVKVNEKAIVQELVEQQIRICPGLENVTEIQGLKETKYYCRMCDSACSDNSILAHLGGFKHRMNSLEFFEPRLYAKYKDLHKHVIDKDLPAMLKDIQNEHGLGRVVVEREILTHSSHQSNDDASWNMPSTSSAAENFSMKDLYDLSCIPDTSNNDFFCKLCESHMNSQAMWDSHVRGKRHLTNFKKAPGALPSKTRAIRVPNARAFLFEQLEGLDEPIVGLDHVLETQIPETESERYSCVMCGATLTSLDVVDHLISLKHRRKYLEKIDYPNLNIIDDMRDLNAIIPVVRDMCIGAEVKYGRGEPIVQVLKKKIFM